MASDAAKRVAEEVLETIGNGKIPSVSKIALKHGYSKASAKNPQQIKKAKAYKAVMAPVIEQLEAERQRAISKLSKTITKAKYRDLVDSVDKLTKNIQLLNGGKTSNEGVQISWE